MSVSKVTEFEFGDTHKVKTKTNLLRNLALKLRKHDLSSLNVLLKIKKKQEKSNRKMHLK